MGIGGNMPDHMAGPTMAQLYGFPASGPGMAAYHPEHGGPGAMGMHMNIPGYGMIPNYAMAMGMPPNYGMAMGMPMGMAMPMGMGGGDDYHFGGPMGNGMMGPNGSQYGAVNAAPGQGQGLPHNASMGRVSSLDVLCALDIIKFPSPQSMESLHTYGASGDSAFPWASSGNSGGAAGGASGNSAAGGGGSAGGSSGAGGSFGGMGSSFTSSLWPSMNNLLNAAEQMGNSSGNFAENSLGSLSNLAKYGMGSTMSLDEAGDADKGNWKSGKNGSTATAAATTASGKGAAAGVGAKGASGGASIPRTESAVGYSIDDHDVPTSASSRKPSLEAAAKSSTAAAVTGKKSSIPASGADHSKSKEDVKKSPATASAAASTDANKATIGGQTTVGPTVTIKTENSGDNGKVSASSIAALKASTIGTAPTTAASLLAAANSLAGKGGVGVGALGQDKPSVMSVQAAALLKNSMNNNGDGSKQTTVPLGADGKPNYHIAVPRNSSIDNFW